MDAIWPLKVVRRLRSAGALSFFGALLSVPAGTLTAMQLHRVTIESAWRSDHRGQRRRQYFAECLCSWSAPAVSTRTEAAGLGADHRADAAAAAKVVRAGNAVGHHPGPAG